MIGYSLGGVESFVLTGADPRIKVLTACVTPNFIRQRWPDQHNLSAIAPTNFVRAIKGRLTLMLMSRNDEDQYTVEEAQALYDLIEGESEELVFYDSGHRLPEEHVPKALEWFKKHLEYCVEFLGTANRIKPHKSDVSSAGEISSYLQLE